MEAKLDCGDNSCEFAENKTGMRTNGGCRCLKDLDFSRRMAVRRYLVALREENARLRGEVERSHNAILHLTGEVERLRAVEAWLSAWQEGKDDAAVFARERDEARAKLAKVVKIAIDGQSRDALHAFDALLRIQRLAAAKGGADQCQ